MQVTHPLADRDAPCPAAVTGPDGNSYAVVDGAVDAPDAVATDLADAWADRYGVDADALVYEEDGPPDTCDAVTNGGDVCGRELPCRYHSEED